MQPELGLAGCELAPAGRAEGQRQTQSVAMERHGAIHIADELDDIGEFHLEAPPSVWEHTPTNAVRALTNGALLRSAEARRHIQDRYARSGEKHLRAGDDSTRGRQRSREARPSATTENNASPPEPKAPSAGSLPWPLCSRAESIPAKSRGSAAATSDASRHRRPAAARSFHKRRQARRRASRSPAATAGCRSRASVASRPGAHSPA